MNTKDLKGQTVIRNQHYSIAYLEAIYNTQKKVRDLVHEYKNDPTCRPDIWLDRNNGFTEIEEISFIYHCLNGPIKQQASASYGI